jgi:hypothetical protein
VHGIDGEKEFADGLVVVFVERRLLSWGEIEGCLVRVLGVDVLVDGVADALAELVPELIDGVLGVTFWESAAHYDEDLIRSPSGLSTDAKRVELRDDGSVGTAFDLPVLESLSDFVSFPGFSFHWVVLLLNTL